LKFIIEAFIYGGQFLKFIIKSADCRVKIKSVDYGGQFRSFIIKIGQWAIFGSLFPKLNDLQKKRADKVR
jgi:hypothetical protein